MPKITAAIQVRMGSSRLPGKTLLEVEGKPLLGYMLDRMTRSRRLDEIVVATSTEPSDDAIEAYCMTRGTPVFRGSENDVLGRMLGALESRAADIGVVAFGDGPLIDPEIVDHVVETYLALDDADLVGNSLKTTYPPGMEAEAFAISALRDAASKAIDPAVREHGTYYIKLNPSVYRVHNIEAPPEIRRPELEIEVDTEEDFTVISEIIRHFSPRTDFTLPEIIEFLDANPEIAVINSAVPRRWKQTRTADQK